MIPEFVNFHFMLYCPGDKQRIEYLLAGDKQRIEYLLAVDLGNTRSCALLCKDIRNINHNEGMQIHQVPLSSCTDNKYSDTGVFDSFISFSKRNGFSFTRVGNEAISVANVLRGLRESGDFYLSSPKKYFWDCDENTNGWHVLGENKSAISLEGLPAADFFRADFGAKNSNSLPRAAMLSSMLLEILEQAENYINKDLGHLSENSLLHVISHVCVTYPAGWSEQERKKYHEVLNHAVEFYQSRRCKSAAFPIVLDVTCDEATAVLLCYVYGELAKYSGYADLWLGAIGRSSVQSGTHARIAVIDVGGGTSDLAIVDIQNKKDANSLNLQIVKLYKDGTNKAGDLLLQKVIDRILVKKIAKGTISETAGQAFINTYIDGFSKRLNALLSKDVLVKQLARTFWFPLAINFITAVNNHEKSVKVPGTFSTLLDVIKKNAEEWTNNNVNESLIPLEIDDADEEEFRKIVKTTFRGTAKLFGSAINAFDADIVILSGKTTETEQIVQIFQEACCLPGNRFIPMWNYMIGDWCPIADADGRISDSKYTTAIGALIYEVVNQNFPIHALEGTIKVQNAPGLNEGNCRWGIANASNGRFLVDETIMKPGENECEIAFAGRPKLLARRRFDVDASEVSISYELRFKPFKKLLNEWRERKAKEKSRPYRFRINAMDDKISPEDLIIELKNNKPLTSNEITVDIGIDSTDDTQSTVVVNDVDAMYEDGSSVLKSDILLWQKPMERYLKDAINVKLAIQTDSDSRALIVVDEVSGKYADGTLVNKNELEIRIRTSGEDLSWLDSGKI